MLAIVAVPDSVMFPLARGVPAVGRTWMPDHVMLDLLLLPVSTALTVMVIVLAVTVAVPLLKVSTLPLLPPADATVAVTVAAVLNWNPDGAFKTIVPVVEMSKCAPSARTGPATRGPSPGRLSAP